MIGNKKQLSDVLHSDWPIWILPVLTVTNICVISSSFCSNQIHTFSCKTLTPIAIFILNVCMTFYWTSSSDISSSMSCCLSGRLFCACFNNNFGSYRIFSIIRLQKKVVGRKWLYLTEHIILFSLLCLVL